MKVDLGQLERRLGGLDDVGLMFQPVAVSREVLAALVGAVRAAIAVPWAEAVPLGHEGDAALHELRAALAPFRGPPVEG